MRHNEDLAYLFRRSVEEHVRAEAATHESARRAHSTLARAYEDRLRTRPTGVRWLERTALTRRRPKLQLVPQGD